jgi:hypothetical protein
MNNPFKSYDEVTGLLKEHGDKAAIDILMKAEPAISDEMRSQLFEFYCQSHFSKPEPELFYCAYVQAIVFGKDFTRLTEATKK